MSARFEALHTADVRFPTSIELDGSDAMNPDPDYSAATVTITTDDNQDGSAFVFTIGRGNDVQLAAINALAPYVSGCDVDASLSDLGDVYRRLVYDSQLRWLGPEKGVMHMAIGAVVNALWDLRARRAGLPLWELLSALTPEEIVDLVDFRYLTEVLAPTQALEVLEEAAAGRSERTLRLLSDGIAAYTTTPGWLGYDDARLRTLCAAAVEQGFAHIKLKVGADLDDDVRRLRIARDAVGDEVRISADANQRWDVPTAIRWITALDEFDLWWVEEPTAPDDVIGHAAIANAVRTPIATGEHAHSRVLFKQLLQTGGVDVVQIDATRVAGVNENIAIMLLAAVYGRTVCPHAGGVGLCELVQHLAMFDFVAVGSDQPHRFIEYVDHLHQHMVDPVVVCDGRYRAPRSPGFSSRLKPESIARFRYPTGSYWRNHE